MRAARLVLAIAMIATATPSAYAHGVHAREEAVRHPPAQPIQSPLEVLGAANEAARQGPDRAGFEEARRIYAYQAGAIYELYANPNYVSTILLEPGETLSDIAAGDTSRWMVTQAEGETESEGRTIVLVKPQASDIRTNIVLITDRRTYVVEASSQPGRAYSAQIAWTYPATAARAPLSPIANLNFNYRVRTVRGARPVWFPARIFDDGRRTWIEFSPDVAASDMAPLFVITADGAELVNYRVEGQRYMVDRVFDVAELRLGTHAQTIVRIERNPHGVHPPSIYHGPHP